MSLYTQSTCLETQWRSSRSSWPENLINVWEAGQRTHKKSWASPSSETSTGTTSTIRELHHHFSRKSRVQLIPAISIRSLRVLHLFWHLYNLYFLKPCKKNSAASHTLQTSFERFRTHLPSTIGLSLHPDIKSIQVAAWNRSSRLSFISTCGVSIYGKGWRRRRAGWLLFHINEWWMDWLIDWWVIKSHEMIRIPFSTSKMDGTAYGIGWVSLFELASGPLNRSPDTFSSQLQN